MTKDNHMRRFCIDCISILAKYDKNIKKKMLTEKTKKFYTDCPKGICLYSITEPILKYLIYTQLLDKYKMWSEDSEFYKTDGRNNRFLDLGIYFGVEKTDEEGYIYPNVAVEMKWANLTKDGVMYKNWMSAIKSDIEKIVDCNAKYKEIDKYFMQFAIIRNSQYKNIKKDIASNEEIINKMSKIAKVNFIDKFDFITDGNIEKNRFIILLWKVSIL